jgi:hypothetical protein
LSIAGSPPWGRLRKLGGDAARAFVNGRRLSAAAREARQREHAALALQRRRTA